MTLKQQVAEAIANSDDPAQAAIVAIAELEGVLGMLTDDQRMDLFRKFCTSCGDKNPNCQCWNDE